MVRACDLKQREVINIVNAERLGYIYDVDIDFETGKILSVIIPGKRGFLNFFSKRNDYIIPWDKIITVGRELVLVRLDGIDVVK